MRGRRTSLRVVLAPEERNELERRLRCTTTPSGLARRSRVILGVADGFPLVEVARLVGMTEKHVPEWTTRFLKSCLEGLHDRPGRATTRSFPPEVAMYVVKIACERPDELGRSLSQWDCTEIARQLVRDGVVSKTSPETVRQILRNHRLKPWRQKMWLSAKVPRDAAFAAQVQEICNLYTRPLPGDEMVLCVDEMTSLQPRPRKSPTLAAKPNQPTRVEHESGRCGA